MAVSLATACAVIGRVSMGIMLGDADRRIVAAANFAIRHSACRCSQSDRARSFWFPDACCSALVSVIF
jgi:hypothetical protein